MTDSGMVDLPMDESMDLLFDQYNQVVNQSMNQSNSSINQPDLPPVLPPISINQQINQLIDHLADSISRSRNRTMFDDIIPLDGEIEPGTAQCPIIHINQSARRPFQQPLGSSHSRFQAVCSDDVSVSFVSQHDSSIDPSVDQSVSYTSIQPAANLSKEQCVQYLASALFVLERSITRSVQQPSDHSAICLIDPGKLVEIVNSLHQARNDVASMDHSVNQSNQAIDQSLNRSNVNSEPASRLIGHPHHTIKDLTRSLEKADSDNKQLKTINSSLCDSLSIAKDKITNCKSDNESLTQLLNQKSAEVDEHLVTIARLNDKNSQLVTANQELHESIDKLGVAKQSLNSKLVQHKQTNENLNQSLNQLTDENKKIQSKNVSLNQSIDQFKQTNEQLTLDFNQLKSSSDVTINQLKLEFEKLQAIKELNSKTLDELEASNVTSLLELDKAKKAIEKSQSANQLINQSLEKQTEELNKLKVFNQLTTKTIDEQKLEIIKHQSNNQANVNTIETLQQRVADLTSKAVDQSAVQSDNQSQISSLQLADKNNLEKIKSLRESLKTSESATKTSVKEINSLREKLAASELSNQSNIKDQQLAVDALELKCKTSPSDYLPRDSTSSRSHSRASSASPVPLSSLVDEVDEMESPATPKMSTNILDDPIHNQSNHVSASQSTSHSAHTSINQSNSQSSDQSVDQSINQSTNQTPNTKKRHHITPRGSDTTAKKAKNESSSPTTTSSSSSSSSIDLSDVSDQPDQPLYHNFTDEDMIIFGRYFDGPYGGDNLFGGFPYRGRNT